MDKENDMIGCLILGTFAAVAAARVIRYRMGWAGCHGAPWHERGHVGHWRRHLHRHGMGGGWGFGPSPADAEPQDGAGGPFDLGWGTGGWGGGPDRADGPDHRHAGRGHDFILGVVLDRLRTTPTQERAIRAAAEELRAEVKGAAGGEGKKTRTDLAAALRKPALDELLLGDLFARQDRALEGTRKAFVGFLAKVHDTLDEEQRGRLAELIEKGPRFWRRGLDW
jgi:hypothetical protein